MREVPLAENRAGLSFAERLFEGQFDMLILLTGVGTRLLNQVIETRWPPGTFADALRRVTRDASLRAALGAENRTRARSEFDAREMLGAVEALYGEVLRL